MRVPAWVEPSVAGAVQPPGGSSPQTSLTGNMLCGEPTCARGAVPAAATATAPNSAGPSRAGAAMVISAEARRRRLPLPQDCQTQKNPTVRKCASQRGVAGK